VETRAGDRPSRDFDDVFASHEDGALDGVIEFADIPGQA